MSEEHEHRIKHLEERADLYEKAISEIRDAIVGGVGGNIGIREMLRRALEDLRGPEGEPRQGLKSRVEYVEHDIKRLAEKVNSGGSWLKGAWFVLVTLGLIATWIVQLWEAYAVAHHP